MCYKDVVIDVRNLSKRYEIYSTPRDRLKQLIIPRLHSPVNRAGVKLGIAGRREPPRYFREFWALNDISFQVRRGETLGIIGRNGSGKSTLLQIVAGTLAPTSGYVNVSGLVAALLELGSGFNPEFTGRENVFLNGRILGLSQKEIEDRYDQIVAFADIGQFIDQPVKTYSSGMFARLAFAVQAHIDASIVIIDEALAVGDVFYRQKCYRRLEQLRDSGTAILLVSHSMPDIEQYCETAILLDHGSQLFIGSASEATKHYYLLHQNGSGISDSAKEFISGARPVEKRPGTINRPPRAWSDLTNKSQVGTGQAHCVGVIFCNEYGEPCNSFRQGERLVVNYEFHVETDIGIPICGIVIKNDRGVIVHGKNSWQDDEDVTTALGAGTRIVCSQTITLDLGIGEYSLEVGLSAVTRDVWDRRREISHDEMTERRVRICHVPSIGPFTVGYALRGGVPILRHHGLADLRGKISVRIGQ